MSSGYKHFVVGLLAVLLILFVMVMSIRSESLKYAQQDRLAWSAFVKTTGNKHQLTFEEWRASR